MVYKWCLGFNQVGGRAGSKVNNGPCERKEFLGKGLFGFRRYENQSKVSTSLQPSFGFCWSSRVERVYIRISEQIVARSSVGCDIDGMANEQRDAERRRVAAFGH